MWPTAAGRVGLRCFCVILSRSLDAKGMRNVGGPLDKDMVFMLSLDFFFFYKVGRRAYRNVDRKERFGRSWQWGQGDTEHKGWLKSCRRVHGGTTQLGAGGWGGMSLPPRPRAHRRHPAYCKCDPSIQSSISLLLFPLTSFFSAKQLCFPAEGCITATQRDIPFLMPRTSIHSFIRWTEVIKLRILR